MAMGPERADKSAARGGAQASTNVFERVLRGKGTRLDHKPAELNFIRSERYFRLLVEEAHDLIAVIGVDGTILYANPRYERVLAHSPDALVASSLYDLIHEEDRQLAARGIAEAAASDMAASVGEFRFRHRAGSWRVLECTVTRVSDDLGAQRLLINSRDVTERKEIEVERLDNAQVAAAVARLSAELISSLASEALLEKLAAVTREVLGCDLSHIVLRGAAAGDCSVAAASGYLPDEQYSGEQYYGEHNSG